MSEGLVKWEPELSESDKAYVDSLRKQHRPALHLGEAVRGHLGLDDMTIAELSEKHLDAIRDVPLISIHQLERLAQRAGGELTFSLRNKAGEVIDLKEILLNYSDREVANLSENNSPWAKVADEFPWKKDRLEETGNGSKEN